MPDDSSPITFRATPEERDLLRAVANYRGESLSAFLRNSALNAARRLLADVGPEVIIEGDRDHEAAQQTKAQRQLEERLDNLRRQAAQAHEESDSGAGQNRSGR